MGETNTITARVLDALASAGIVTVEQIAALNEAAASGVATPGALVAQRGLVSPFDLATVLEEELGIPRVDLASYAPDGEALTMLPAADARELGMLPLFEIEGMLTVAIGEAFDIFELDGLATRLGVEVEAVLADSTSVLEAIAQYYPAETTAEPVPGPADEGPPPPPVAESDAPTGGLEEPVFDASDLFEVSTSGSDGSGDARAAAPVVVAEPPGAEEGFSATVPETIEHVVETAAADGPPAIDLDVLAVADAGKTAVLVSDILEHAVRKGANRIHLLPYKDDFFLVHRSGGRLEKIASAPLSMQGALVDAIKSYARLSSVPSTLPALGRLHSRIAEHDLVVTVSAVPTVAGQRVVISFAPHSAEPKTLLDLGMSEAESRALHAMVERGRGILLVSGPVAGGRSSTYYALLAHAAAAGKTAYSVESSVDFELPAVAQVLVNPGSPVGAASYFAAGMRQDTDVMAIDSLQSVEDVHLAIEAAGLGKLVIATFSGGDIVSGVRRMLDLGAEPTSLASALTLGVGQRLVRTNCPNCSQEETTPLAAAIPGAPANLVSRSGSGCPNCGKSGFSGATGIFEVLPFTEPVRTVIARDGTGEEIAQAARAAGMRPMAASGLSRVSEGRVSAEELNRVLRFSG